MPWSVFASPITMRKPRWTAWIEFSVPTGLRHPHALLDANLGYET
jgi:hypothetical protein